MHRYVFRKLVLMIPSVFAVVTIVFLVLRFAGGDPATAILGDDVGVDVKAAFRAKYGLDQPLPVQYVMYLGGILTGNLGTSFISNRPVIETYLQMLPSTVELIVGAVIISILIGLPLGVLAALRRNSFVDYVCTILSTTLLGFPGFFLAILLLLVFAVNLRWFPVLGTGDPGNWLDRLHHLVLPALALGLVDGARVFIVTRASVLNILGEDYVRTARAKGMRERRVVFLHALRNALIPIVVLVGLEIASSFAGAVLVETVFNRPGVGRLLVGGITARDYPLVQSGLLIYGVLIVVVNLITDLMIGVVDPKVSYA